ncbi:MAG: phenylalanine--tRNA ligase subunit beta [Flavobacteriaceae bacterium]|nr:phenylalanine--tRNA ligase subunit beta [Eudoraea sp.]NNJ38583.1 phenylalanine--tRNA ligase subunit beta [Flavobacteriaceae bacterium]
MKISYNWLKQFITLDWDSRRTGDLLTSLGLEVEGISSFESIQGGLKGVVVGEVLSCIKHPNADKLKLTTVDIGTGDPLQIVCGAPNVAVGQKVPVATIGTTLYTAEGESWIIKKGKIRGEASYGMICAEDELGLGDSHEGIMVLNDELKPGTPCSDIFEVELDEVFEIGLTPNRADAMSHFGVARDLKAGLLQQEIHTGLITPSVSNFNITNRALKIDVEVVDAKLAPRYCGLTISNLIVQPSPDWLKNRLRAIGLSPINNIVDATNYVLHELGQPLHAFDADRIYGKKIVVRPAKPGSTFMTLDGEERDLHEEDLMICDSEKPMCIAGVFGGINTGVTEDTRAIFLESAYFDPVSIRKSAKRHGLNTDASFRFERGIDINNVEYALKRAALLICEIAGGDISSDIIDLYPKKMDDHQVFLTFEKINTLIGQEIPRDNIKAILASLDIQVKSVTESGLGLLIPSYRVDVQREVDVIEEILRVYGYDNIHVPEKLTASIAPSSKFEDYKLENAIGQLLAAKGFSEILSNSLTNPEYSQFLGGEAQNTQTLILNPLSTDLSVMRQSLLFSGLEAISHNLNRRKSNLRMFEFGMTYHYKGENYEEKKHLTLLLSGSRNGQDWTSPARDMDFYYLKATTNLVFKRFGIEDIEVQPTKDVVLSEGLDCYSGKTLLASLGVVRADILKHFDIKQEVLFADFQWENVSKLAGRKDITYREVPKYPDVKRDFALLLDDEVPFERIRKIAFNTEKKLLKKVNLFDVYTGKNLPKGKKSYAVSFTLQDEQKTLTDKQIDKIMNKLRAQYEKELGAELR